MNAPHPITTPVSTLSAETMAECAEAKARLHGRSTPQVLRQVGYVSYTPEAGSVTATHLVSQYQRNTYMGD